MSQLSPVFYRQNFDNLQCLSAGTYATVYRGGDKFALKASSNLRMSAGLDGDVTRESEEENALGDTAKDVLRRSELIEAMIIRRFSGGKHPNVLSGGQIFFDSFVGRNQFSQILQVDLAHGSLHDFMLNRQSEFKKPERRIALLKDIANGIAALHNLFGVCHGDLKPDNILLEESAGGVWLARLADFGLSTFPAYAVHGHASECYTFGHVPPECCDRFVQEPHLIRDTPEAHAALCSFSCFAAPVSASETPSAPPTTPSSRSSFYCNEDLSPPSTPMRSSSTSTPEIVRTTVRPRQANSAFFDHVTRANLASDIWAFGSVALFISSLGVHPVIAACFELKRACRISSDDEHRFQINNRMQMTFWYKALRRHQKSSDWERVFDFDSVANRFALLFADFSQVQQPLKSVDFESCLGTLTSQELEFIYSCLQFLPEHRLLVDQLCKHAFLNPVPVVSTTEERVGRKRRQIAPDAESKKLREEKPSTLLSVALTRVHQLGQSTINMPFHQCVTRMLIDIATFFRFSYKSLLLANAYIHVSANRILADNDDFDTSEWTKKNCIIHAVTCLWLAVSLFEPRHEGILEITDVVEKFGQQYDFTLAEIATFQRLLVDCIQFEFDIPTMATFIDLSLAATKTTSLMPTSLLLSKVLTILFDSEHLFSCSQAVLLALAFLKRFGCNDAFEHLLLASGQQRLSVDATLLIIE